MRSLSEKSYMVLWLFITALSLHSNAEGVSSIEISPAIATPGTILTVTVKAQTGMVALEFDHLYRTVRTIRISDGTGGSGLGCGDQDPAPGSISTRIQVPYSPASDSSSLGRWSIHATDDSGDSKSVDFMVVPATQATDGKDWIGKLKSQIADVLIGMRASGPDQWHLWIMNANGANLRSYRKIDFYDLASPVWSPDGRKIAFTAKQDGEPWKLYLIADWLDIDSEAELLVGDSMSVCHPAWSPDSKLIAFVCGGSIKTVDVGSRIVSTLYDKRKAKEIVRWPDRETILFATPASSSVPQLRQSGGDDAGAPEEFQMTAPVTKSYHSLSISTGVVRPLPFEPIFEWMPGLSDDKRRIVFDYQIRGRWDIWTLSAVGDKPQRLLDDEAEDHDPAWSPDSHRIVFVSNRPKQ